MSRLLTSLFILSGLSLTAVSPLQAQDGLIDNLGNHAYDITTSSERAQAFFNQGLRLYYGFNHAEAINSFRRAQELDPGCAMCFWGEALAWGPNINMPMDVAGGMAAYTALQEALDALDNETPNEKALIHALEKRYSSDPAADRQPLDAAYADAMREAAQQFPNDNEIAVLYAEAVMTTMPWDYWDEDRRPREGIPEALESLTIVQERDREHPGACHFYIHAVEKFYPEKAVDCAERLADLMPGAGHIVHMPGHIYIRVGRYQDAIDANRHAVHADETYIQDRRPGVNIYTAGYYPHNYDFMAFAATMVDDCDLAVRASENVRDVIPSEILAEPGFEILQHYATRPLQMLVRCERWDDILTYDAPDSSLHHARAMWHYATGRALAATGKPDEAESHLVAIRRIMTSPALQGVRIEPNEATDILTIADHVLDGWIGAANDDFPRATAALEHAAKLEDQLLYGEPPEWSVPVRQDLGEVYLMAQRFDDAERAFAADLDRFPENAVSKAGLERARLAKDQAAVE